MTIDDEQLRELGEVRWPPTYRPPAEIAARARTLRRRRDLTRAGVAVVAVAAAVATTVVALRPAPGEPQPSRGSSSITVPCPRQKDAKLPLPLVEDLVLLPPVVPVANLEAHATDVGCREFLSSWELSADQLTVAGVFTAFDASELPRYRKRGDLPGRYESRAIGKVQVRMWRVDAPRPQLRAYWTGPDGRAYGVHAESFGRADDWLAEAVRKTTDPMAAPVFEPPAGGLSYVRTDLDLPGDETAELRLSSVWVGPQVPVGARLVAVPGAEQAVWWEADGVGHLSWHVNLRTGQASGRSLSGRGLTQDRAVGIAGSLVPTPLTDPRLPRG